MANPCITLQFNEPGDYNAMHAAERFLRRHGFSIGQLQGPAPRAVMFGDYDFIAKWRNLTPTEKEASHGRMTGCMRDGPVSVTIFDHIPDTARIALGVAAGASDGHAPFLLRA